MPAYRSEAETEIRDAVVARLRHYRPGARIMHEVNILRGVHRVDVLAVDPAELIMVEIKSARDTLDRLADQVAAMQACSHIAIAALHRKFMPEPEDLNRATVKGLPNDLTYWWHPGAQDMAEAHHPAFAWPEPDTAKSLQVALPPDALSILWREELAELCFDAGIRVPPHARMREMTSAIRWGATGRQITRGICKALRRRKNCAEADAPMGEDA